MSNQVDALLTQAATLHRHLCPRIVLGVRMGLWAGEHFAIAVPQANKRLLTLVETDGCFADGVAVATNCWLGRRTMRIEDYGKVAATFVDTHTGQAVRLAPHPQARQLAHQYAPEARNKWEAMLLGYQRTPVEQLLTHQTVRLCQPISEIISRAGHRVTCAYCHEEIINQREVHHNGMLLCRACAGSSYYHTEEEFRS